MSAPRARPDDPSHPPHRLAPVLTSLPDVRHGFFGRQGGVSTDPLFASLNCGFGSGDERAHVQENRARVAMAVGAETVLALHQIHSAETVTVTAPWDRSDAPRADAMATKVPSIGLGILTADCCPILLADGEAGVIGAAHAGWRGALAGIVASVVTAMAALGARPGRIRASLGPTISQANYEVGPGFPDAFLTQDTGHGRFFEAGTRDGHWQFDLPGYVRQALAREGVTQVHDTALCTYADEANWFSFRRTTHRGEPDYGRNLAVITLAGVRPAGPDA
ncbi:MAG: peptidoglycan editing factor PgeF [Alphaproteobacteria bacterium]